MPRNGSGVYSKPAGTTAVPNTTITSGPYNSAIDDIAADLNTARPVVAGGTGGSTPAAASAALFPGTSPILLPSINGGAIGGLRNLVLNGSFRLNQRGFAGGALGAGIYGFDRWKADAGGCTFTVAGTISGGVATITAGTLVQIIPAENIEVAGTYTISWAGTATCTVNGSAATTGSNVTLAANTNVTLKFTGGTLSNVQLEFGTVATVFERRPVGLELLICQRFFEKSYDLTSAPGSNQGATIIGAFIAIALNTADFYTWGDVRFKVPKFATTPTLNYWAMNGTQGVFFNASTATNQGNIAANNASQSGFRFFCGNNALTANNVFAAHWSAESEL